MKYNKNEVTGKMRDRIILQNVTRVRSLTGFASEIWTDTTTIWAFAESKLPGSNETIIEGKNTAKNICDFTIRYISSITEESRVVFKNKIYQVKNIKISHDRRFISFQGVYYDSYSTVIGLQSCSASLLAQSSLSAALMRVIKYQASLNAFGSVSADIALVQKVASSLNAFGTLTGDITFVQNMQAALNGTAALSGGINFVQKPEASLLTSSSVTGNIIIPKLVQASLTGAGTTAADLTVNAPSTPLLLDTYPSAAVAYSLRKLRTAYTGSAIRVRRSSDNTEQDIGFVSDQLDTVSLLAFCGAGNGFVTTWYDQSNNARNATQTVQASQPQVVSSGTIINVNNKPSLLGNGSYFLQVLSSTSAFNFIHNGTLSTILSVQKSNSISVENRFYGNNAANSSNVGFSLRQNSQVITNQISRGVFATNSVVNISGNILTINQCLLTLIIDADNATASQRSKMYLNQGSEIINNANLQLPSVNDASLNLHLFTDGGSPRLSGNIQEFVVYDTDQSINRVAIQTNINTHYAIY